MDTMITIYKWTCIGLLFGVPTVCTFGPVICDLLMKGNRR